MGFFSRHRNTVVLAFLLLSQLLGLAVQVKRQTAEGPVRLIRLLSISIMAPCERLLIHTGETVRSAWGEYIDLHRVRRENQQLKAEADELRLERARDEEQLRQAHRIQALLAFKEQWIDKTVAAQVIGTSGSENSRLIYIDRGSKDGIKTDMPVITPDGVVGKVLNVYGDTSQVLLISDPTSGVGGILVNSRLQGIVKGTPAGEVQLNYIMSDEQVQVGEQLVTSGGDRVFPKGLPLGTVAKVTPGRNLFFDIKLKPSVNLNKLEEVLVITEQKARAPESDGEQPVRASDILASHLPGIPPQPPAGQPGQPQATTAAATAALPGAQHLQQTTSPPAQPTAPPTAAKQHAQNPVQPAAAAQVKSAQPRAAQSADVPGVGNALTLGHQPPKAKSAAAVAKPVAAGSGAAAQSAGGAHAQ